MKVVIDIPEQDYELACKYPEVLFGSYAKAIKKGIVLPDKLTNGAVICLLYPNIRYVIQNGRVVTTIGVASSFDLDWWNAPYRKDGEK